MSELRQQFELLAQQSRSRERASAMAGLSREALASGDRDLAVEAKFEEARDALFLRYPEHCQHCVVAGVELDALVRDGLERSGLSPHAIRRSVWGFKYAITAALAIPQIPIRAIDGLIDVLGRALEAGGFEPYARWHQEARRHWCAGDTGQVRQLAQRLWPHVNLKSYHEQQLDCPSCARADLVRLLDAGGSLEEIEGLLGPVLRRDKSMGQCAEGLMESHARYSLALSAAGRAELAFDHASRALVLQRRPDADQMLVTQRAATEAARLSGDRSLVRRRLAALMRGIDETDDAYDRLAGMLCCCRVLRELLAPRRLEADEERLAALEDGALALARQLDARLERPRHVDEVRRALDG